VNDAPGVAAFQIVTVAEVMMAAFVSPIIAATPRTEAAKSKRFMNPPFYRLQPIVQIG
jgi:hypothetical protein